MTAARTSKAQHRTAYAWPTLFGVAALLLVNIGIDQSFLDPSHWPSILAVALPFLIIAMAAAPAIISGSGGIDLSIGPAAGLTNAVIIAVLVPLGFSEPYALLPAILLLGLFVGGLNGILVILLRVPPIIATLGTYLIWSGLTLQVLPMAGGIAPAWVRALSGSVGIIPLPVVVLIAIALVWMPLMRTAYRRNLMATGGDQRTAFTSGIPVNRVRLLAYMLSGLLAAAAGFAFTVALGSGDPVAAAPYTLIGIAGAVLGGVGLAGGRGGLLGACAGGAALFLIQNLLSLAHVSAFYAQVAYGVLLVGGLALNSVMEQRRNRREQEAFIAETHA